MALAIGWTTLDLDGLVQILYDWCQEAGIDDFLNSNVLKSSDNKKNTYLLSKFGKYKRV